ncbi:MAG: flagellar assembly protein FliX [Pseudomonadota bacterium]
MKVTGPNGVAPAPPRRASKKSPGGFSVATAETREPSAASSSAPIASVDALIALQGDASKDESTDRQAVLRAEDLLGILDDIRLGLLGGALPRTRMAALVRAVEGQRLHVEDPKLAGLLDEIDLRARVELAKLEAAA